MIMKCLGVDLLKLYMCLIFFISFGFRFCVLWYCELVMVILLLLLEMCLVVLLEVVLKFFSLVIICFIGLLGVVWMMMKLISRMLNRVGMISSRCCRI